MTSERLYAPEPISDLVASGEFVVSTPRTGRWLPWTHLPEIRRGELLPASTAPPAMLPPRLEVVR
jgi:hypothetical protein